MEEEEEEEDNDDDTVDDLINNISNIFRFLSMHKTQH